MSYNLTSKTCFYCGRHYKPGYYNNWESNKDEAWTFAPMTLGRVVFGMPERITVCKWPSGITERECLDKAIADGYVERPDLIPVR